MVSSSVAAIRPRYTTGDTSDVAYSDIVAKVFSGDERRFPGTADAFRMWRCEDLIVAHKTDHGPALQSLATEEVSKNLLSRDFRHRSIFDFCNNIDPQRTTIRMVLGPDRDPGLTANAFSSPEILTSAKPSFCTRAPGMSLGQSLLHFHPQSGIFFISVFPSDAPTGPCAPATLHRTRPSPCPPFRTRA